MEKLSPAECEAGLERARSRLFQAKKRRAEAEKHFRFRDVEVQKAFDNYEWWWKLDNAARTLPARECVVDSGDPSDDICLSSVDCAAGGLGSAGAEGRPEGSVQEETQPPGPETPAAGVHGGCVTTTKSQCESHPPGRTSSFTPTAVGTYCVTILDGDSPTYPSCPPGCSWSGRV